METDQTWPNKQLFLESFDFLNFETLSLRCRRVALVVMIKAEKC